MRIDRKALWICGNLACGCMADPASPTGATHSPGPVESAPDAAPDAYAQASDAATDAASAPVDAGVVPVEAPSNVQHPVVLAAGAFGPAFAYEPLADRLRARGYDVRIFVIANPLQSMAASAPALAAFVDDVLADTGASKVDMITHSQSGLLARYYTRFLGGATKIDSLISMSGLQYGSELANIPALLGLSDCIGVDVCVELAEGSDFIRSLTEPNDTDGNVRYVNFASKSDILAIPYTNNHLYGTGTITNVTIQDQCPLRFVGHITYITDGTVASGLYDALAGRPITLDCFAL